ncbi:MAG: TolC family outer membrane protein [Ramlibacter sp.]
MHNEERTGRRRRSAVALAILLCGPALVATAPAQTGTPPPPPPAIAGALASAEKPLTLREAVQLAVVNNPEVLQQWHTVRAAENEREAARGGLFPRVDITAGVGPERRTGVNGGYSRGNGSLTLSQLLYDGFASADEVRRLDHAARVRLFELVAASENIALEAARAYLDVLRYRELVRLAEENFVEHRAVFAQTDQRVKARVARAVDLEQITGRLALAEANLLIETANLHDTTARFQRIVGRLPTRNMQLPAHFAQGLPGDVSSALAQTSQSNATVLAAVENVRAAAAALDVRESAYQPRVDLQLRRDQGRNVNGVNGGTNATVAELVLNWNLFNGFADRSRERQFAEQLNAARDARDKACRDTRQTTMIAYNDVVKLREQLEYLQLHESSLARALTAYRLQFQIGQRSLLDLLDTENERFQARRAVVNAQHELAIAYVRTQAGIGNLLRALEVSSLGSRMDADLRSWNAGTDAAQQCPPEAVAMMTIDKDALVQRALQQVMRNPSPQLQPLPDPAAPGASAPVPPAPASVAIAPAAPPAAAAVQGDAQAQAQVRNALEAWRAAWEKLDVAAYLQSYGAAFAPPQGSRAAWEKRRQDVLSRAADVSIALEAPEVKITAPGEATVSFTQAYKSASYQDRVRKTMGWRLVGGRWVIVSETAEPAPAR